VTDIISLVDKEFKKMDDELCGLKRRLDEKEAELHYCECETKKEQEVLSVLIAANSFRSQSFDKICDSFAVFQVETMDVLQIQHINHNQSVSEGKLVFFSKS